MIVYDFVSSYICLKLLHPICKRCLLVRNGVNLDLFLGVSSEAGLAHFIPGVVLSRRFVEFHNIL